MSDQPVHIVGGGMAGSEAALQLAARGIPVVLHEMRPTKMTEAHHTDGFAELVCSNSFRGDHLSGAVGLLKEEMRRVGGFLVRLAEEAAVPAGGALAVDRDRFSALVSAALEAEELIEIRRGEVTSLEFDGPAVIATGPLTSSALTKEIIAATGEDQLYFYDSIAPIIDADSINLDVVFAQSRYDKGEGADYLNCPMTETQYISFIEAVNAADLAAAKDFEETKFFEACLPIEVMAGRGLDTLRFGPMKPVGLTDPRTGERPWAVIQLRMENIEGTAYNMVGFQTRMKWGAQKEIFRSVPGLEDAEFLRFGSVHRNTFIHGPKVLNHRLALHSHPNVHFAGQITGVEGYVESMSIGLMLGVQLAAEAKGDSWSPPPTETALGGLWRHVTGELAVDLDNYQPSNVNWGMLPRLEGKKIRKKRLRRILTAERALNALEEWMKGGSSSARLAGFIKNEPDPDEVFKPKPKA